MELSKPTTSTFPAKRTKYTHLTAKEQDMVRNVYAGIRERNPELTTLDAAEICGTLTKMSSRTVFRVLKGHAKGNNKENILKTKGRKKIILDENVKYAIRRKIHGFFFQNEIPTLTKILQEINKDSSLPKVSLRILKRTLKEMNFRFLKRNRKSILIEKSEITLWRRNYLKKIRDFRENGKQIYYTDETWLNEGHTVGKVWQDLNIKSSRQAFMEGFSRGLSNPTGKGRRLIITHIGSESGFLDGGLNVFESRKTGDYHEDMNSDVFERWFSSVLTLVESGSVIVMDNAPYHSRRQEKIPTTASRKADIAQWLTSKNINFEETMLKVQLLELVRLNKNKFIKYAVDEMAREKNVTVLRLPPYHCELNPIELIWAQIKSDVARKNKTFKLAQVKILLNEAISNVTTNDWQKCVLHIKKEEQKMWDLDIHVEAVIEPIIITPGVDSSSDSEFSESNSDSESM